MVKITVDLIRKRAEHNEGEISTLEEISLHQENIEKIELLNRMCRNLKILLMQNNIIGKIENLNMLKRLEYLNLALNNIEVIENLQGLESLRKLDLTINFIGDLRGIKSLRRNENLEILYLTGNPCADYIGYREYVVATLVQLRELDSTKIERSERILALQNYSTAEGNIIREYGNYRVDRDKRIIQGVTQHSPEETNDSSSSDEDERCKFWKEKTLHTPEERIAIAEKIQRRRRKEERKKRSSGKNEKYVPKLFAPDGRPYNVNQARVSFTLDDETDRCNVILEIRAYKHLDTRYLEIDAQPSYIRVTIKGKILQLCLPCEISIVGSEAKRNATTGNLVITMPRLFVPVKTDNHERENTTAAAKNNKCTVVHGSIISKRELLEIGPPSDKLDFSRIYRDRETPETTRRRGIVSENFVDDPRVPPLE